MFYQCLVRATLHRYDDVDVTTLTGLTLGSVNALTIY